MQAKSKPTRGALGVVESAKRLGVDLFEYSRLRSGEDHHSERTRFTELELDAFRRRHRIDDWWTHVSERNQLSKEQVVRTALGWLIERGIIDEMWTRRDNLWRGLDDDRAQTIQQCVEVLLDEGVLFARGRDDISVAATGIGTVHVIASGVVSPPALVELWGS